MRTIIKSITIILAAILIGFISCQKEKFSLGTLTSPTNLTITADIVGKTVTSPNGDGSGKVNFTFSANDAISYKVDFGDGKGAAIYAPTMVKSFTKIATNHYRVMVSAIGKGGITTTAFKEIDVFYAYDVKPAIVTALTNDASKKWVVDKSVAGHFKLGPWGDPKTIWWSAGINEKVSCCNCFYTATYTFSKGTSNTFSLKVTTDGNIFANADANNLGITGAGESCYSYAGSTKEFYFGPSVTGISASFPSTQTNINIIGSDGFIGYGSASNTYEILELDASHMYLYSQGVNPANAWFIRLVPIP